MLLFFSFYVSFAVSVRLSPHTLIMFVAIVSFVAYFIGPYSHIRLIRPTTMLSNIDNFVCLVGFHSKICLVIYSICIRTDCKAQIEIHFSGPLSFNISS